MSVQSAKYKNSRADKIIIQYQENNEILPIT